VGSNPAPDLKLFGEKKNARVLSPMPHLLYNPTLPGKGVAVSEVRVLHFTPSYFFIVEVIFWFIV